MYIVNLLLVLVFVCVKSRRRRRRLYKKFKKNSGY